MLIIERALRTDVTAIVALLADDPLGAQRETPDDLSRYLEAFEAIDADPHQYLAVARRDGRVVGTLQLTLVPGLSRRGAARAQVEGVRVHADERGGGLGSELLEWAEREAEKSGCVMIQLTSDAKRKDAHRFYERLGYEASHVGFKKRLG
ncbi:GNAT family acetyltransferase [Nocardiopsis terrae]|uniref:GNAT superfamily N-acetyltransferase n=1 Tax=Nocardiopsis terrae TaxID=372655 RepID=A0ABR9HCT0_9ACTN|nr:GNAT family N-acetyltransferase [Nocardiopsis terrae]MBE1456826.1 GNAT superfamily N-acetyltransferase [Nocardiopsis terrae]GHC74912.1 GNAT family acetyltransferase [Nocardiopsis terrae]